MDSFLAESVEQNACSIILPQKLRERKRLARGDGGDGPLSGWLLGGSLASVGEPALSLEVLGGSSSAAPSLSPLSLSVGSEADSGAVGPLPARYKLNLTDFTLKMIDF